MAPRPYQGHRRKAAQEETRGRIILATVALHAEKGVTATTHADIAKLADVAIPTVYKHFPTRADLLPACISHVAGKAPALGPHLFDGKQEMKARLDSLVHGLFETHAYYAPWLRWATSEAELFSEIKTVQKQARKAQRDVIRQAFSPGFSGKPPGALLTVVHVLLDFPAWKSLTTDKDMRPDRAEALITDAIVTLVHHYQRKEKQR